MCNHATIVDTAFEQHEVDQPDGGEIVELTRIEIEHCLTCERVVEWRGTEI